jgi:F-type H+-transporting ATPase subunit b
VQFNWFTFVLELVNFAVLGWVLSRILYRPIRAAVNKRQAEVRVVLADAEKARSEAAALDTAYQERMIEWKRSEEARRADVDREIAAERTRRLARVEEELRAEREAEALARTRRADEERARQESEAIVLATSFASRLLSELAGPELHHRILEHFLAAVPHLPAEVFRQARRDGATIDVRSPYPIEAGDRERIARAFGELLQLAVSVDVHEAPELIAGVEVHVGAAALEANVAREMAFFAEVAHG